MPSMRVTLRLCRVCTEGSFAYTQFKPNLVRHTITKQIFMHTQHQLNIIHRILCKKKRLSAHNQYNKKEIRRILSIILNLVARVQSIK
jgi:hypothetical protein